MHKDWIKIKISQVEQVVSLTLRVKNGLSVGITEPHVDIDLVVSLTTVSQ